MTLPPDNMYRVTNFRIDEHEYPYIDYPSKDYYKSLIVEWATRCKLEAKNSRGRRNFRCVHCCRVFTSKHRVNSHRYVIGCDEARLPNGEPAALYPYPNLKVGGGKFVEMLAAGKAVHFGGVAMEGTGVSVARKARTGELDGDSHLSVSGEDDEDDSDFEKTLRRKPTGAPSATVGGQASASMAFTPLPVLPEHTCGSPKGGRTRILSGVRRTPRATSSVLRGSAGNNPNRRTLRRVLNNVDVGSPGDGFDPDISASQGMGNKRGGCTTRADTREEAREPRKRAQASRDVNSGENRRCVKKKVNDTCNTAIKLYNFIPLFNYFFLTLSLHF